MEELARRRILKTFQALFEHAHREPLETARLIAAAVSESPLYGRYAEVFLLGLLQGSTAASTLGYREVLKAIQKHHGDFMSKSPKGALSGKR